YGPSVTSGVRTHGPAAASASAPWCQSRGSQIAPAPAAAAPSAWRRDSRWSFGFNDQPPGGHGPPGEHPAPEAQVTDNGGGSAGGHQAAELEGARRVSALQQEEGAARDRERQQIDERAREVLAHEAPAPADAEGHAPVRLRVRHRGQRKGDRVGG